MPSRRKQSGELHPEDADVLVEQGEWRKTSAPQTIGTLRLGPCLGVGLYIPGAKDGYVGHFVAPAAAPQEIDEMFDDALTQTNRPDLVRGWGRGGGVDPNVGLEYALASRNYVVDLFAQAGIVNVDVEWSDSAENAVSIILACRNGAFRSTEQLFDVE